MRIGYLRGHLSGQQGEEELVALEGAGCDRIFVDSADGRTERSPALEGLVARLKEGDELIVVSLDHLATSMSGLVAFAAGLAKRGVGLAALAEDVSVPGGASPEGRLLVALNTFDGAFPSGRGDGREDEDVRPGRPRALTGEEMERARDEVVRKRRKISQVAREFGISRATLYRYLAESRR